jgi:hypothetical protein
VDLVASGSCLANRQSMWRDVAAVIVAKIVDSSQRPPLMLLRYVAVIILCCSSSNAAASPEILLALHVIIDCSDGPAMLYVLVALFGVTFVLRLR